MLLLPQEPLYFILPSSRHLRCRNKRAFKRDRTCRETFLKVLRRGLRVALIGARNLKVDTDRGPHTSQQLLGEGDKLSSLPNSVSNVLLLHLLVFSSTKLRRALSLQVFWSALFVYTRDNEVHPLLPALPLSYNKQKRTLVHVHCAYTSLTLTW
jgi:hypothetical protein